LNKIEQLFHDTFLFLESNGEVDVVFHLIPQKVVGIYKVDFVYGSCAIEIDGYEYHKTKEQREHDYKRERYLMKNGYTVVRFTASEVYLEPRKCVIEALELGEEISIRDNVIHGICKKNDIETIWGTPLHLVN